jgi:S-adenosylmethionine:tRNA ribosyltransferase-isomerase
MKLSSFKYDIPQDLVAQHPLDNRDDSRLLVVDRATGTFEHKNVQRRAGRVR